MTITPEQEQAIRDKLAEMPQLSVGVGNEKSACSVAAINLALTGELTDTIPDCMSEVVGYWIIAIQDKMPDNLRNSEEWRRLLPLAAGTGREYEKERLALIMDWMWESLARFQPQADEDGFGVEWRRMCEERTGEAATAAIAATVVIPVAYACTTDAYLAILDATVFSAAASAARATGRVGDWGAINPCGLLKKLITLET